MASFLRCAASAFHSKNGLFSQSARTLSGERWA